MEFSREYFIAYSTAPDVWLFLQLQIIFIIDQSVDYFQNELIHRLVYKVSKSRIHDPADGPKPKERRAADRHISEIGTRRLFFKLFFQSTHQWLD